VTCVRRKRTPSGRGAGTEWLKRLASRLAEILEGVRRLAFVGSARHPGARLGRSGSKSLPASWQKFLRRYGDLRLPEAFSIRERGWDEVAQKTKKFNGLRYRASEEEEARPGLSNAL